MKTDGSSDDKSYVEVISSVQYFTNTNKLSGAVRNWNVQLGVSSIQSAIDVVPTGGSIQVSTGGGAENLICAGKNYVISGSSACPFGQTTQIAGNVTIGSASVISTRVRIKDIKFIGNLSL